MTSYLLHDIFNRESMLIEINSSFEHLVEKAVQQVKNGPDFVSHPDWKNATTDFESNVLDALASQTDLYDDYIYNDREVGVTLTLTGPVKTFNLWVNTDEGHFYDIFVDKLPN